MRGPYAKVAARNGALLERVRELKADHPFWGYRRGGRTCWQAKLSQPSGAARPVRVRSRRTSGP